MSATLLTGVSSVEQYGGYLNALSVCFGQKAVVDGLQLLAPADSGSGVIAGGTGSYTADRTETTAKVNAWEPADAGQLQLQVRIQLLPASAPVTSWMSVADAMALAYAAR